MAVDVKVYWAGLDTNANPFDAKVYWAELDTNATPFDIKVYLAGLDTAAQVFIANTETVGGAGGGAKNWEPDAHDALQRQIQEEDEFIFMAVAQLIVSGALE